VSSADPIARHELIATALGLGIERPDSLSNEALVEAIQKASDEREVPNEAKPGWFAVARHLVESVVEQGLNLPNAAKVLRAVGGMWGSSAKPRPPLPTVTLAQIYMSQGHDDRARATLERVLGRQPDNHKAQTLLAELERRQALVPQGRAASKDGDRRDLVVVVRSKDSARVYWELGVRGTRLLPDEALELLIRVFQPSSLGPGMRESRHGVSSSNGVRGVPATAGECVCAALVDVHDRSTVLGVAPVYVVEGDGLELQTAAALCGDGLELERSRALARRMLESVL
jgi:hypothetical protein